MKCKLCDWVSQAEKKEMAELNLDAHYYYIHDIKPVEKEIKNTEGGRVVWTNGSTSQ